MAEVPSQGTCAAAEAVLAYLGSLLADPWGEHMALDGIVPADGLCDAHICELAGLVDDLSRFHDPKITAPSAVLWCWLHHLFGGAS